MDPGTGKILQYKSLERALEESLAAAAALEAKAADGAELGAEDAATLAALKAKVGITCPLPPPSTPSRHCGRPLPFFWRRLGVAMFNFSASKLITASAACERVRET